MSLILGAGNAGQVTPTYSGLRQVLRDQINDSQPKFIAKDISEDVVPERLDLGILPNDTRRQWKKNTRVFLRKTDRNKRDAIAPNNTSTETTPKSKMGNQTVPDGSEWPSTENTTEMYSNETTLDGNSTLGNQTDSPMATYEKSKAGIIVGGTLGALASLTAAACAVWFWFFGSKNKYGRLVRDNGDSLTELERELEPDN
eukprot:GHVQ01008577.1.p1 GENE.GHVQ01008577.1~~GHVQ01008577.1.p1  ORF type:complete len:200 (+),score=22.81 GHVQ01008577.1:260-859(+)